MSAATFRVTEIDVLSMRRDQRSVWGRATGGCIGVYLTGQSFPMLGRRFGDRDHTTATRTRERHIGMLIESHGPCLPESVGDPTGGRGMSADMKSYLPGDPVPADEPDDAERAWAFRAGAPGKN